jgi:hypothetical protein
MVSRDRPLSLSRRGLRFGFGVGPSTLAHSPDFDLPGLIRAWQVMATLPVAHIVGNPELG